MPLRATEDRVALLKIESTYGVDISPVAADAMLLMNSSISPMADKLERNTDSPFFGADPFVLVGKRVELEAEVDLLGALIPGTASPLGALYRVCGHTETLVAAPLVAPVNAAFSTSTTGGSIAAGTQSYRIAAFNGAGETLASTATTQVTTGATSTVTVNWAASAGAIGYKIYGRAGGSELLLAQVGNVLTWIDTGANTPLGAQPGVNTTVGTVYSPISKAFVSGTVYFYQSGILFKMTGVRGYMDIDFTIKNFGKSKIKLTGLFSVPADGEAPANINWAAFQTPAAIETETWEVKVGNVNVCAQAVTQSCNATVNVQECSEAREVTITDRKPTGSIKVFKDQTLAVWNPWTIANNQAITYITNSIVKQSGLNVLITHRAQLEYPKPTDIDGTLGYDIPFSAIPSGAGGDEYTIAFR